MRFTINREQLLKGLTTVSKAVNPKPVLPLLSNIKLCLNEKGLEIIGLDQSLTIKTIIPYMINDLPVITNYKNGETLINCRILNDIVRRMEGTNVTLELIDNSILKLEDEKSNFRLNALLADEFPDIDLSLNGAVLEIQTADFVALVEQTAFAAAQKHAILTAVNLDAHDGVLTATATDTARLARKKVAISSETKFVANIQAKNLLEIAHSFEGATTVTIAVADKKVLFLFDNTIISTTLANSDYPNTKNIFPKSFNYTLEVNSKELLATMERVSLLSADRDGVVKLVMTEDEVELFSRSSQVGSANEKLSTFQFNGERLEISFRSSFVADAVRAVRSEDVVISFVGEMKPFVVKSTSDDTIDMLVTPLRS